MSSKGSPPIALILLGATATAAVVIAAAFVFSSRTRSKRCGNRNETTASLLDKNSSNEEEDNSTPRIVNNDNSINNDGGGEAITENKVHVSEIAETHNASCQSKGMELPLIIGGGEGVGHIAAKEVVESAEGQEAPNPTSSVAMTTKKKKKKKKKDKLRPKLTPSTTNNEAETNNNDDDDDDLGFGEIAKTPLKKLRPISTTTPKEKGDKKPPDDLGYTSLSSYWKQQENKNVFVAPITPVGVSLDKKKKMGDDNKVKSNNSNDVDDDMNIGKKEDSIALALDYPSSTVNEVANQQTNFESDEAPADAMKVVVEDDGAADQGLVEKILLKK